MPYVENTPRVLYTLIDTSSVYNNMTPLVPCAIINFGFLALLGKKSMTLIVNRGAVFAFGSFNFSFNSRPNHKMRNI